MEHDADPVDTVPEHSVLPPEVKITVPVAPDGRPVADSMTELPYVVAVGDAPDVKDVDAFATTVSAIDGPQVDAAGVLSESPL